MPARAIDLDSSLFGGVLPRLGTALARTTLALWRQVRRSPLDSLGGAVALFAAGAIAASGALDARIAIVLLAIAAVAGDAVNYSIGRSAGHRIIQLDRTDPRWARWVNPAYIERAHAFFERHGGKAIVLARFVPIVRTFVPFVAGVAEMSYRTFALYNVTGGVGWVVICIGAGYLFGNVPVVRENFSLVALGIVLGSLVPMVFEFVR